MKKIIIYIVAAFLLQLSSYGQNADNSAVNINLILQFAIKNMEDSNRFVVHAESGIFSINNNSITEHVKRELYTGGKYTIKMFTDANISDFKLRIWKMNKDGDWLRVDSVDRHNNASIKSQLIGDREEIVIEPEETAKYAFQLVSLVKNNKTGRYGLIIVKETEAEEEKQTTNTKSPPKGDGGVKFFSIETKKTCFKDNNGEYTRCSTDDNVSLFEFNESETILKHTTNTMTSSYFVTKKVRSDENSWYQYTLRSDVGNTYLLFIPDSHAKIIFFKNTGDEPYYMIVYGVRRYWTE